MSYRHKILIVDDDVISLAVLAETLSMYETATASSGEEALAVIDTFHPDMMLLDVNMPGISGYEVCRAVRLQEETHLMRILLVSANMSVEERLRGYNAGADDYVIKPFSPDELKAKVEVFLKLKSESEVDEAKNNLIGLFTHETRTPLGVIIGFSDILRVDVNRDEETRICAQAIYENAIALHQFIEKATLLSKLKSGYTLMRTLDPVSIHLNRAVGRVEPEADEKHVTITIEMTADLQLMLDWEIFDEAIGYVIENAVKFSEIGGEVLILTRIVENYVEILVSDGGKGITTSWIGRIFDEFAIRDIRHHKKGQGLSLSVVKKVVELHGGTIEVDSRVGKGTKFAIRLPITETAGGPAAV